MNPKRQILFKSVVSAFIVFHLLAIFILPNPDSILYRETASIFTTYGNQFVFNTTWRFFSPNPSIRLLQYEVFSRDPSGHLHGETFQYPDPNDKHEFRENINRHFSHAAIMMTKEVLMQNALGPLLCRKYPGAETISISARGRVFSNLEKAKFLSDNREDLSEMKTQYLTDVSCEKHEGSE